MTKNKVLGAFLNFILPGLGNFYARKTRKGILTYILSFIVVLSLRFIAYNFTLFLIAFLLIIGFYLYLIISGYQDVEKHKEYGHSTFDKWYVYILIILFHWGLLNTMRGGTLDAITPINFASIPTRAMDPALQVGDILAFKRTKSIERNDVIIFWFPDSSNSQFISPNTMYIKRSVGLPGDTLQIKSSMVWINGVPLTEGQLRFEYLVTTDGAPIHRRILEKNNLKETDYYMRSSDMYQFFLLSEQAQALRELKFLKSVERSVASEGKRDPMAYPASGNFDWNADFYGPLYIPKKGDKISLSDDNIDLYLRCIESENGKVTRDDSGLMINGQLTTTYQFKENYFFMMGDNRHDSLDSRFWGLVPEKLIIGKAMYLYWGSSSERIGKRII